VSPANTPFLILALLREYRSTAARHPYLP